MLKRMSDSVPIFKETLLRGDFQALGEVLQEGWALKKQLAANVSSGEIDMLHGVAMAKGAWGGKVLGAGSGGCLMMLAPVETRECTIKALSRAAADIGLQGAGEIPVSFVQTGAEILLNSPR